MIGRTGLHAIKALAALAQCRDGEYAGAAALAASVGSPGNYLGKLLQSLARAGLVEGRKGLNGGFRLARPADQISLYDVVEPIERVSRWNGCFMTQGSCSHDRPCRVHERWASVREIYVRFLKDTTVRDLSDRPTQLARTTSPSSRRAARGSRATAAPSRRE
jgi:Rrf2 family protein